MFIDILVMLTLNTRMTHSLLRSTYERTLWIYSRDVASYVKNAQSSMFPINNSLLSFFDIRDDVCDKSLFVFTRSHHLVR